jgi:hypothetical protein
LGAWKPLPPELVYHPSAAWLHALTATIEQERYKYLTLISQGATSRAPFNGNGMGVRRVLSSHVSSSSGSGFFVRRVINSSVFDETIGEQGALNTEDSTGFALASIKKSVLSVRWLV